MADAATNRKRQGVNTGCRHMWGRECVCVAARLGGVKPLLALCTWKKNNNKPLTCRHYELMASKGENLIWYKRHSDVRQKRSGRDSDDGCCWFGAISAGLCLSRMSVCFVLGRVSGDSHAGPLIWKSLSQVFHCQQGRSKCACWQSRPHSAASDQLHAMWQQHRTLNRVNKWTSHRKTYFLLLTWPLTASSPGSSLLI